MLNDAILKYILSFNVFLLLNAIQCFGSNIFKNTDFSLKNFNDILKLQHFLDFVLEKKNYS